MIETIKSIPLTFYSREFYQKLVRIQTGIGMDFVALLTLFAVINVALTLYMPLHDAGVKVDAVMDQMPEMTVKDHVLSIDKPVPYTVKIFNDEDGKSPNTLVIDTNYAEKDVNAISSYMNKNKIFVFVTAHQLVTRQANDMRVDNFDTIPDGTFGHDKWMSVASAFKIWMYPISMFVCAIAFFISSFFMTFLAAIVTTIFGLLFRVKTDFAAAMRIGAASGVPAAIVITFLPMAPYWAKLVIWAVYIVYGLSALQPVQPSNK